MSRESEYLSFIKLARVMANAIENEVDEKNVIGMFMNQFFRLPSIFTGLVSQEAAKMKASERTPEHFYGRTESAQRLLKELRKNPCRSDAALMAFVKSRCRIHRVTSKENNQLKAYHKINPNAHWRKAYVDCQILLQPHEKQNQKYVYKVNDVVYNNITELLNEYNIDRPTLASRCKSKRKWPAWQQIEKDTL